MSRTKQDDHDVCRERDELVEQVQDLQSELHGYEVTVKQLGDVLRHIASMKCPDKVTCSAYDRGECQAGQAREALQRFDLYLAR